jgi:cell division protein FtsA
VAAGVVLTGGASKVEGVVDMAESIFNMPVRLGAPQHVSGLTDVLESPSYATGVGLLMYGQKQQQNEEATSNLESQKGLWARMKRWFQGNF